MLNKFLYRWAPSGLFQPSTKNEHSSGARSMGQEVFPQITILLLYEDFSINGWRIFLKTQIKIILTTIGDCDFSFEKIFTQFVYYNCNHWLIFIQNRYHSQFCTVKKITNSFFFNQVKKMKCSGATGLDISSFPEIKVDWVEPNPRLSIWRGCSGLVFSLFL